MKEMMRSSCTPQLSAVLGGFDPMAPLSSSHREIFRISGLIHKQVESGRVSKSDGVAKREARRLLYSLEDLLRLHFTQEEELFEAIGAAPGRETAGD